MNVKFWEPLGVNDEGRRRLGNAVRADRMRKYRTVDAARIAAKISRGAWDNVEQGKPVKDFTLGAIEDALDWPAGRAHELLYGVEGAPQLPPEIEAGLADLSPEVRDYIRQALMRDQAAERERGAG